MSHVKMWFLRAVSLIFLCTSSRSSPVFFVYVVDLSLFWTKPQLVIVGNNEKVNQDVFLLRLVFVSSVGFEWSVFHHNEMIVSVNGGRWIWQERHRGCFLVKQSEFFTPQQNSLSLQGWFPSSCQKLCITTSTCRRQKQGLKVDVMWRSKFPTKITLSQADSKTFTL